MVVGFRLPEKDWKTNNCLHTNQAGFFVIITNKEEMPDLPNSACKLTQRKIDCWGENERTNELENIVEGNRVSS